MWKNVIESICFQPVLPQPSCAALGPSAMRLLPSRVTRAALGLRQAGTAPGSHLEGPKRPHVIIPTRDLGSSVPTYACARLPRFSCKLLKQWKRFLGMCPWHMLLKIGLLDIATGSLASYLSKKMLQCLSNHMNGHVFFLKVSRYSEILGPLGYFYAFNAGTWNSRFISFLHDQSEVHGMSVHNAQ